MSIDVSHLQTKAHVKVVEIPKPRESPAVDKRPTTITERQPRRSATCPQKSEENNRPIITAEESKPA